MNETPIWIALGALGVVGGLVLLLIAVEGWHRRGERRAGRDSAGDANPIAMGGDADAGGDGGGGDGGGD